MIGGLKRQGQAVTVLHLIAPTHFGGAERIVLNLAEAIDKFRFRVVVGSFVNVHFPINEFVERMKAGDVLNTVFWLKQTVDIGNIARIVRFIRSEGVDIIHTHGYRSDIIGLIAARISSRPIVATIHGFVPIDSRLRFYENCDRFALRFFDRLLPVSGQICNVLERSGIPQERMTMVRNAVTGGDNNHDKDQDPVSPELKQKGDFLIGIVGRLSPEKNIPGFLEVAAELSGRYSHLKFVVVGDGPERAAMEEASASLQLDGKVRFTGFIDEMETVYQSLNLLVIASSTEGIPLVVLEAMKHGIPVVSTRVGGIPEVIDDGIDGVIVAPGDMRSLARAVEELVVDSSRYRIISQNARERALRDFSQSSWIRKIEECYCSVLNKREEVSNG